MGLGRKKKDWRIRNDKHPVVSLDYEINRLMQRQVIRAHKLSFVFQKKVNLAFPIMEFLDGHLFTTFPKSIQEKFRDLVGDVILMTFVDEGKQYYAYCRLVGFGTFHGQDAARFQFPGFLQINDSFNLTDLHLDGKVPARFMTSDSRVHQSLICNIGLRGIDLITKEKGPFQDLLSVGDEVVLSFHLSDDLNIRCRAKLMYLHSFGVAGFAFLDLKENVSLMQHFSEWLLEMKRLLRSNAEQFLKGNAVSDPAHEPGAVDPSEKGDFSKDEQHIVALESRFEPVVHPGEPMVLVVSHHDALIDQFAKAMGDLCGVCKARSGYANVLSSAQFLDPQLVIIHDRLPDETGFDLCKKFTFGPKKEIPVLIMGPGLRQAELEREALQAHAVGFLVVDPFDETLLLEKMKHMIDMFCIGEPEEMEAEPSAQMSHDYETTIHTGDPSVLIASPDDDFVAAVAGVLRPRYGVYRSYGSPESLRHLNDFLEPELILINEVVESGSGFDACKQVTESIAEKPILIAGPDDNVVIKRNQAMQLGAVDYVITDPMDGDALLQKVHEVMVLFGLEEPDPEPEPEIEEDFEPIMVAGDAYICIAANDFVLCERLSKSLGPNFGVVITRGQPQSIVNLAKEHPVKMVLIHEQVVSGSGFEICGDLANGGLADIPILMIGTGENKAVKENMAIQHGAVGFVMVQPFLKKMVEKHLDEVFEMFGLKEAPPLPPAKQETDYPSVLHEGKPWVLVATRDEQLLKRMGEALQKRYGVLATKGRLANIEKMIEIYQPCLVILHETLGNRSGFEMCEILQKKGEIPVMVMGKNTDMARKKHQVATAGGVDFLMIDPYIKELVYGQAREVIQMFQ